MKLRSKGAWTLCAGLTLLISGCDVANMRDEARLKPFEESAFFENGRSAQTFSEGTIPRGSLRLDKHLYTGKKGKRFVKTFPYEITEEILNRGRERYNIYCSVCHDRTGNGQGMVVRRGFRAPRSYHTKRIRRMRPGEVFSIITEGRGAMPSYSHQIPAEDRWAIVAYVRALLLSQNVKLEDLSPAQKHELMNSNKKEKSSEHHS